MIDYKWLTSPYTHTHIYIYINKGMPLVYFSTVFFHSSSSWCGRLIYIHKRTDREQSLTPSIIEHSPFHFFPWLSMRSWDMAQQSLIKSEISRADSLQTDLLPGLMIHWWHVKETLSDSSSVFLRHSHWTTETQCMCASNKRKSLLNADLKRSTEAEHWLGGAWWELYWWIINNTSFA